MLPAGKTKKEIALQLAEQGMKAPEIAKKKRRAEYKEFFLERSEGE